MCDDTRKLIRQQQQMNEKSVQTFTGLSVHDTVKQLLRSGDIKTAEKIKSDYKVPDKRYWWLRIQVFAELEQWDELEKLSKVKKSPIGYEPFAEVCLKRSKRAEARKYIMKSRDENKAHLFIRAK